MTCGWFDFGEDDDGVPRGVHCTSGKPATFRNCGYSVMVCEDHRCRCHQPTLARTITLAGAQQRVKDARWDLGGILLNLLRAGESRVTFDDPRVAHALVALREAEDVLASLGCLAPELGGGP